MKVALYSPYLDSFGGGERYILTIAETLSDTCSVDLLFDKHLFSLGAERLKKDLAKRFNLDLFKVNTILAPIGKGSNPIERTFFLKNYDIFFYLTDGSIFYPFAKRNILHIQSPLVGQPAKNAWGRFKLKGWDLIIYNSEFTKNNSQKLWPLTSKVIYPPVDVVRIKPQKKRNYILSVGRFFGYLKDKKQEVLIQSFKELYNKGYKDWSLHLVGSAGEGDKNYLDQLEKLARGFPIKFYPNLGYDDLINLYGQASIYWHAAGFREDNPVKMEHFGISTVEAMAAGCVPVVIGKGGQLEIVENNKSGYLWQTLDQLKKQSQRLIENSDLLKKASKEGILRSKKFSKEIFKGEINKITK